MPRVLRRGNFDEASRAEEQTGMITGLSSRATLNAQRRSLSSQRLSPLLLGHHAVDLLGTDEELVDRTRLGGGA